MPDVGDAAAPAGIEQLDGLIAQGGEQAQQNRPAQEPQLVGEQPGPQQQEEAFHSVLAEVSGLAHHVFGQAGGRGRVAQASQK